MTVRTFTPRFRVLVTKNVFRRDGVSSRQSASQEGGGGIWDITGYLGDGSTISVSKSLYRPCGSAIITVPDQPFSPTEGGTPSDTLYGLLEPTDGVEIYLARSPEEYGWNESAVGQCPVIMRGFVREITRTEQMGADGKPRRYVVVQCQDYGAVFDMLRVWMLLAGIVGIPDKFQAFFKYGGDFAAMKTADFMQLFVDIGNEFLDGIFAGGGWTWNIIPDFSVTEGEHVMMGLNGHEGPLWGLMMREMDAPWNELFFEDRKDGPTLIYRVAPWKTYEPQGRRLVGTYLPQGGNTVGAEEVEIDIADIVSLDPSRSDYDVANLFWLDCPVAIQGAYMQQIFVAAVQKHLDLVKDDGHQNNDRHAYGDRMLKWSFRQWPNGTQEHPVSAKKTAWEANSLSFQDWWAARLRWMRDANRDNVVLENGSMTVKGDENIRVGKYVAITRGQIEWEAYAVGVTHTFAPFQKYTTKIDFIRGTSFWARTLLERNPAWGEGKKGPYD